MTETLTFRGKKVSSRRKVTKIFWSPPFSLNHQGIKSQINSLLPTLKTCLKATWLRPLILWEMVFVTADKSNWA